MMHMRQPTGIALNAEGQGTFFKIFNRVVDNWRERVGIETQGVVFFIFSINEL